MADESTPSTHEVTEDGTVYVPLKLAHPMAKVYAERARAKTVREYKVGDTIWVTREYGNALIDAGMVQIDPMDTQLRQSVLLLNRRNQPLTAKELAEKVDGDESAAVAASAEKQQSAADAPSAESDGKAKSAAKPAVKAGA